MPGELVEHVRKCVHSSMIRSVAVTIKLTVIVVWLHLPVFLFSIPDAARIPIALSGTAGNKQIFYTSLALIT